MECQERKLQLLELATVAGPAEREARLRMECQERKLQLLELATVAGPVEREARLHPEAPGAQAAADRASPDTPNEKHGFIRKRRERELQLLVTAAVAGHAEEKTGFVWSAGSASSS